MKVQIQIKFDLAILSRKQKKKKKRRITKWVPDIKMDIMACKLISKWTY